ncbi:MAG: PAS domain-containing protein [Tagaea sp.]
MTPDLQAEIDHGFVVESANDIASARNRRLFAWWREARGEGELPRFRQFDPVENSCALGHVSVATLLPDGDFRYRVDGSHVVEYFGVEMTGKRLSEYPYPARRAAIQASFETVRAARKPVKIKRDRIVDGRSIRIHLLLLPFADGGPAVTDIMSCLAHGPEIGFG